MCDTAVNNYCTTYILKEEPKRNTSGSIKHIMENMFVTNASCHMMNMKDV